MNELEMKRLKLAIAYLDSQIYQITKHQHIATKKEYIDSLNELLEERTKLIKALKKLS